MQNSKIKIKKYAPYFIILILSFLILSVAHASTNIDSTARWAWNDSIGWIDFFSTNTVNVLSSQLQGFADSSVGFISLDCASGPPGSNCNISYRVNNDGAGNLSGWAWSEAVGWISFSCVNTGTCATLSYQVQINANGEFSGWAWNNLIGWISFSCVNTGTCATSDYRVRTTWRFTVDPAASWAWNDSIGWIDFFSTNTVNVLSSQLQGFADSSVGFISLDCASGPPGSNCNISYRVNNDGAGNLSGWAWSENIGWISFACHNPETGGTSPDHSCVSSNYQVQIDANGEFSGWAWNDTIGWISFSCVNTGTCATSDYRVRTAWRSAPAIAELISSTFDTGRIEGAAYNYIVWRGSLNNGAVRFQLATANCPNGATNPPTCNLNVGWGGKTAGDGAFLGPDGTPGSSYNPGGPEIPVRIVNQATHNNRRFYRYRMLLESNLLRTLSPLVEDVIVNWSP